MKKLLVILLAMGFCMVSTSLALAVYKEAPMLAELVKVGKLPPVEQRLPKDPCVVEPIEEIGQYGGTWREVYIGGYLNNFYWLPAYLAVRDPRDVTKFTPDVAKSWELSPDSKVWTFHLREGMRWSDGVPFTADDIVFWNEDILRNTDLTPSIGGWYMAGGQPCIVEKVDDYTVKFKFAAPYPLFLETVVKAWAEPMFAPKHYCKQFHPKYTALDKLNALVKKEGFDNWVQLFMSKRGWDYCINNPDLPVLGPFKLISKTSDPVRIYERNPYYHKVDTAGNQLPYIDRMEQTLVASRDAALLKILAGEVDFSRTGGGFANYSTVMENRVKGDYRVVFDYVPSYNWGSFICNFFDKDPVLRKLFRTPDFKIALSLAINRDEMNSLVFRGMGTPGQIGPVSAESPYFVPEVFTKYIAYDLAKANELLDKLGLGKRDSAGFRLRPDGKRLTFTVIFFADQQPIGQIAELECGYWQKLGIEAVPKPIGYDLWDSTVLSESYNVLVESVSAGYGEYAPHVRIIWGVLSEHYVGPWAKWWNTGGKEGEEPPAEYKRLRELYDQISREPSAEKRVELEKEVIRVSSDFMAWMGVLFEPAYGSYFAVKNNFRNVPENFWKAAEDRSWYTAQFFFKK